MSHLQVSRFLMDKMWSSNNSHKWILHIEEQITPRKLFNQIKEASYRNLSLLGALTCWIVLWILICSWTGGWKQGSCGGKQIIWRQRLQCVGPRSEADNIKVIYAVRWACSRRGWWTSKLVQQEEEEHPQQRKAVKAADSGSRRYVETLEFIMRLTERPGMMSQSSCLNQEITSAHFNQHSIMFFWGELQIFDIFLHSHLSFHVERLSAYRQCVLVLN